MWVLTPSGAVAWPFDPGPVGQSDPIRAIGPEQTRPSATCVDPATGAVLSLSRRGHGAVMLNVDAAGLAVSKLVTPAGTFDLRLVTEYDTVRVTASKTRLTVTRGRKKAVLDTDAVDDLAIQRLQLVLAGSGAVRQFRQIFASMSDATRRRPEGAALATVEAVLGWLQGDVDAVRRAKPPTAETVGPAMSAFSAEDEKELSCYKKWEAEVIDAWSEYESCVMSFEWWNPAREVCAFLWVLRVESAWFSMIGCSAIPIKIEAP
jgi:hypothetical protein